MHDWLDQLLAAKETGQPLILPEMPLFGKGRVLSLAPHPDDPDAVGVLLRAVQQGGWEEYWIIVSSGWSGVQDDYAGPDSAVKTRVREEEQRAAARVFGLPEDRLSFLHLFETTDSGEIIENEANRRTIFACLDDLQPDLVVLPHGDDTHPDHRLVYRWCSAWAQAQHHRIIVLGNEDPKSENLHPDLLLTFGEETAAWKTELLECHHSQSIRNQATRGITFAQRILTINRHGEGYAERFQVAVIGA